MASTPAICPSCKTDDGLWAYGRLIFDNDPAWPHCMICKSRLVPVGNASIVIDLTADEQGSIFPARAYASLDESPSGGPSDGSVSGAVPLADVGTASSALQGL